MPGRREHESETRFFLQEHLSIENWIFSGLHGTGRESYFAQGNGQSYFVKIGVQAERYIIMAELGLTPPVLTEGQLEDGTSLIIQPFLAGHAPSRLDYRNHLVEVAQRICRMHHEPRLQRILSPSPTNFHKNAGLRALNQLCQKWGRYRAQVPMVADFVDKSLEYLAGRIDQFSGEGLVCSHGDICNANWLFASDGKIYLLDFESMSMDDPALDMGALLWWYYPPDLRQRFLDVAGYRYDEEFRFRMQIRMAMHCLNITLPRENSFDSFDASTYSQSLIDFRAILNGEENPQGYDE